MTLKIYPVIHLLDVPTAIEQALIAHRCGAHGVFLIAHGGGDDNAVIPDLAGEIKKAIGFDVGINLLGVPPLGAFEIAQAEGIDMLWLDVSEIHGNGAGGEIQALAYNNRRLDDDMRLDVFAAVAFKYQPDELDPPAAARTARRLGFIPTTSGVATGEPPTVEKIISMAEGPLAVASGLDITNVRDFAPFLSHILVATGVSSDEYHFDEVKLMEFINAAHSVPNRLDMARAEAEERAAAEQALADEGEGSATD